MGNVPQFVLWPNLQGEFWGAAVYVPPGVWLKDICKQWHKHASQVAGSTLWLTSLYQRDSHSSLHQRDSTSSIVDMGA